MERRDIFLCPCSIMYIDNREGVKQSENKGACSTQGCSSNGCSGNGGGCSGPSDIVSKVELISDCRCVVCKKVGFQAQKQFEKKAISVFDVECEVQEALDKISSYYNKLDFRKL